MNFSSLCSKARVPVILSGIMALGITSQELVAQQQEKPNILMIMVDDLNDWIGVMNAHPNAKTPNIDRLAERGTLFTNTHAAAPLCGPTRAALLSGLRPSTTGIYGHNNYAGLMKNEQIRNTVLLPAYFARHGYKTLATGKVFHEGSPREAFDEVGEEIRDFGPYPEERVAYTPPPGLSTSTDWGAYPDSDEKMPDYQYAMWAIDQLKQNHDKPFLLCVGFVRPHVPLFVPQKWFDMHPLEGIMLPLNKDNQLDNLPETSRRFAELPQMPNLEWMKKEDRWRKFTQAYLASCTFVDHYVGQVLNALAESKYAENTIIVLLGDHGYHVGTKGIFAKHTLWEDATRTPLVISRPNNPRANRTHKPANHMDIYPTLLELANLPPKPDNEGKSLVPLLDDPEAEGFTCSITTHGFGNHAIRTERWRFIKYEDGTEELYDHLTDPHEWVNLANKAQYTSILEEHRKLLPAKNLPWDPNMHRGSDYNPYFMDLFERTKRK